ncbi:MAG TPA: glycosyltransferase [Anaerolineales bacterium]
MRILYFSTAYSTHDHRFLSAIAGAGHEVYYLRLEPVGRQIEDRPVPPQVHQVQWAGGRTPFRWIDAPRLAWDLRRVLREIKPDVVHAGPIQTCAFLAALTGFHPLLTMSWGFDLMQDVNRSRWWQEVTRFTLRRSTFFTSDAQVTRDMAVAYGMDPDRTVVFPWGVDLEHFRIKKWHAGARHFVLFCNRSWEPRYGVDVLARAFVKVAAARPNVGLILLGGGSQGQAIRQIFMSADILDRVYFGGQVAQAELPRWYHEADLYISPSHVDGSSVSLMEALACGLPALVSDIPANKEWVTDGQNGWLFRDGDADELSRRILDALARPELLPMVGLSARGVAEARADWKKNAAVLLQTYDRILELEHIRRSSGD